MHTGGTVRPFVVGALLAFALVVGALSAVVVGPTARAADASTFDAGNIIDDSVFYNSSAMSAAQVQAFLSSKVPRCAAGYTCLKDYSTSTFSRPAVANRCGAYDGAPSESAALIIWKVAQVCGVNPEVLVVLLQKEQGLVTSTAPSDGRYRSATGYGCPDTAPCDSLYYGFYNQLYMAAYQFKVYRAVPRSFGYQAGRTNAILWNPNAACGRKNVYIANQATAGLYNYTPYTPNDAALANLYGIGDGCSSYGNRNFWAYFTDWFGPTTADAHVPFGSLDDAIGGFGSVRLRGWTIDPDTSAPITINVYIDGIGSAVATAGSSRPDVSAAYPAVSGDHGFDITIPMPTGQHTVCVYAINQLTGRANPLLGCRGVVAEEASPQGAVTLATAVPGTGAELRGWALDPETSSAIEVRVYRDGTYAGTTVAGSTSTDVPARYGPLGSSHGFDIVLPTTDPGLHTYCAYGINVQWGDNALVGCATVRVLTGAPIGSVDAVTLSPGLVTASGWVLNPQSTSPMSAVLTLDGLPLTTVTANSDRPDVGAAYPAYGSAHGFEWSFTPGPGPHRLCVTGSTVAGSDSSIGCLQFTSPVGSPTGSLDSVTSGPGVITASGWGLDPDTSGPIAVHIYVDGTGQAVVADSPRSDVASAFSGYGENHGYVATVRAARGAHNVCAYGINVGYGTNALLGCRQVVVPGGSPIGALDSVRVQSGMAVLEGWAIDPDTADSVSVDVWIDGRRVGRYPALGTREDVGSAFAAYGSGHGYAIAVPVAPGSHAVCVYGIDSGSDANSLLGCKNVVAP